MKPSTIVMLLILTIVLIIGVVTTLNRPESPATTTTQLPEAGTE